MTNRRTATPTGRHESQSAFVRGFIDDGCRGLTVYVNGPLSQSAFVRGFIDDRSFRGTSISATRRLNPRSCAASSMTEYLRSAVRPRRASQSAFVRGFIDDRGTAAESVLP